MSTRMTENRLSPSPSSPITVLHVDDDPAFVETTATFIEHEDDRMSVRTATSANEGMEQLSDEIDCVVSDYEMPNKTGIEFLETLRDTHPDLPFILFTGRGSEAVASQAISAGVTDYLQKETSTEQYELLCNRIENLVDRHRKAKRLEQTKRRFEKVFEQSNDGILIIDPYSEEIRNVNPRACELLCYERDELLSMSPEEIHPHQLDRFRKFVDEVYDEGQGWTEELSCYKKDGETIRAHISASTITVEDNRYMLAIIREMGTWSMHSGNRELVRTLLDYSSEGIYIIDPETGQFVDVNQTACHRLGYDRQELVSMAVPDIDGSGIINDWEDHVERVVTADWTSEGMSHLRKDGTTYPVELSVRNIARGDDQHYLVAVARDISDK